VSRGPADRRPRFGAVLEEFEVRDALEGVYVSKLPAVEQMNFASQPIAVAA